jgi:hypothetical protein
MSTTTLKGIDMKHLNVLTVLALWFAAGTSQAQAPTTWTSPLMEGTCTNGAPYKLQSYRVEHSEKLAVGYAYEGPLGQGTVLSSVSVEQAKRHVCKESAVGRWLPDDGDDQ